MCVLSVLFSTAVLADAVPVIQEQNRSAVFWAVDHGFPLEIDVLNVIEHGMARANEVYAEGAVADKYVLMALDEAKLMPARRGTLSRQSTSLGPKIANSTVVSISSIYPTSGSTSGATTVCASGLNFESGATVTFGGTLSPSVTYYSCNYICARTPGHSAGASDFTITNPDMTSATLGGGFNFVTPSGGGPIMNVISVSPQRGATTGGTSVTISGSGFAADSTVQFVSATGSYLSATGVSFVNSATLTAVTPAGVAGLANVYVHSNSLATGALGSNLFRYTGANLPPPSISTFTTSGAPGSTITINGANFTNVTGVRFAFGESYPGYGNGSIFFASASFSVVNPTQITATVPNFTTIGPIEVDTMWGPALTSGNFTALAAGPPTISTMTPGTWETANISGTAAYVTGTNLNAIRQVTLNGKEVQFYASSATGLYVYVDVTDSTGTLSITNTAGSVSSGTPLTVNAPTFCNSAAPPTVTSFSGGVNPVDTATINGSNLTDGGAYNYSTVVFSGQQHSFHFYNPGTPSSISVPISRDAVAGPVTVITDYGVGTSASSLAVAAPGLPTVSAISVANPAFGSIPTITGTNLNGVYAASVGGITFAPYSGSGNATTLNVYMPLDVVSGPITVYSRAGTATGPTTTASTSAPSITSLAANVAPPGNYVLVSGNNFTALPYPSRPTVLFNGVQSPSVSVFQYLGGTIRYNAQVPIGAGTGPVTVITGYGSATSAGNFTAAAVRRDVNADGRADVVLYNAAGDIGLWTMNGANIMSGAFVGSAAGLTVVGTGDFNGDGRNDILFRDAIGGVGMWLLDGSNIISGGYVGSAAGLSVDAIGDFNGDGKADILFRDAGGGTGIWFMNGTTITSGAFVGSSAGLTVVGTGDFNGDGKSDILFRDGSGGVGMWLMNGSTILSGGYAGSATGLTLAGIGDFNGDGKADIVFMDGSGGVGMWIMNGATISSGGYVGSAAGFSIAAVGDYDGDLRADLLLRNNTTGDLGLWRMNGTLILGGNFVSALSSSYSIAK